MWVPGAAVRQIMLKASPDRLLRDGDAIEGEGFRWEVVWTPGHSPGHVCLYERERRLLLSGDHVLPVITPHVSYSGQTGADPLGDFLTSLERLKPLDVATVLPAHEYVFEGLQCRIEEIEEHHEERMQEVLAVIRDGPRTPYEIAHHVTWVTGDFRDFDFVMQGAAVRETLAHLEHALVLGLVAKSLRDDLYWYQLA
jgi:glyoxylase-like metal-dependent hydrolase (beta-lactamase superfamily II)